MYDLASVTFPLNEHVCVGIKLNWWHCMYGCWPIVLSWNAYLDNKHAAYIISLGTWWQCCCILLTNFIN